MGKVIKKKNTIRILVVLLVIGIISLIVVSLIQFGVTSLISKRLEKPEKFEIRDECSLILGKVIHQIKDEGNCKIMCLGECEVRNMEFYDSEFIEKESDCHVCYCYCR